MPPFLVVDGKPFSFHGLAEEVAEPARLGGAAGITGPGSFSEFVVDGRHLDGLAGLQIVQSDIDGAAAVVARALGGVGDVVALVFRGGVPEDFGDEPGAVGVVDEESVAVGAETAVGAEGGFGGGALEEGAGLGIDGGGKEVVGGRVLDIEADGGLEGGEVDEIGGAKVTRFGGRGGLESVDAEFGDGTEGLDPVNSLRLRHGDGGEES